MPDESLPASFGGDRYAVMSLLGEGGQASSYHAVDKKRGSPVVVKRFRVRGAKTWKEVELAEREANVLSSLSHESLPRYVDHFEEGGELFLVTEYIEGENLAKIAARGDRLDTAEVVRFLRQASETLDYLHGRAPPVIHRDIKPSNVLRRLDRSFAFIDFGAVQSRMKPQGGSTIVGTFGYMAPEQFQGRAAPASDVYAVATTALVLLTGVEPEELPHKGLAIDVDAALSGTAVEPWLVRALTKMLEPDPDKRASRIAPLLDTNPRPGADATEDEPNPWPFRNDWTDYARRIEERARRKADRIAERAVRKAKRSKSWVRGYGEPLELGGVIRLIVGFALRLAEITVKVALLWITVPFLTLLSVMLGRVAREAIEDVKKNERFAQREIARARAYTVGKPAKAGAPRVRIATDTPTATPENDEAEREAEAEEEWNAEPSGRRPEPRPLGRGRAPR